VPAIQTLPSWGTLADDLARLFKSWQGETRTVHLALARLDTPPAADDQTREASRHLVRLWAADQVRWLQAVRRADDAVALAASHQLVTPLSGAVVLETAQQYAQQGLTPADPTSVPAIPEPGTRSLLALGLAVLLFRPRRRQSSGDPTSSQRGAPPIHPRPVPDKGPATLGPTDLAPR
jgi:hypothetical protein